MTRVVPPTQERGSVMADQLSRSKPKTLQMHMTTNKPAATMNQPSALPRSSPTSSQLTTSTTMQSSQPAIFTF
jgi:hypothetical protein